MRRKTPINLFVLQTIVAGLLLSLASTNCHGAPGDLYVANLDGTTLEGSIVKYTPSGARSTFDSSLFQPQALAFDREGNLFVADSDTILKFAPDGSKSIFATVGVSPYLPSGMGFDGAGNLFVSDLQEIFKFAPDGTRSTFSNAYAWALAFDKLGNLYAGVVGPTQASDNSILKFATDGSSSTFFKFYGDVAPINTLTFDHEGNLFAQRGGNLLKITPSGESSTFKNGYFKGAAFDGNGNLFVGVDAITGDQPGLLKFAPDGTQTTFAFGPLIPFALAFEPVTEKLRNISARGFVGTGDNVLIGGFIVGGNALANNSVIARAIGPSLASLGIASPLADPKLELHDSSGTIVASNDDWQDSQESIIAASGLAPTDTKESAIYATLSAGSYTAIVSGANNTTGTALVEVYSVVQ